MTLQELVDQVEGFNALPPRDTIRLFSWWLHVHGGRETLDNDELRKCNNELNKYDHNVAKYTSRMTTSSRAAGPCKKQKRVQAHA